MNVNTIHDEGDEEYEDIEEDTSNLRLPLEPNVIKPGPSGLITSVPIQTDPAASIPLHYSNSIKVKIVSNQSKVSVLPRGGDQKKL